MDVARSVHIPIVPSVAVRTAPLSVRQSQIDVLIPTDMAEPATRKEPPDLDHPPPALLRFVAQILLEQAEPRVAECSRQFAVLDQPVDIQVFHSDVSIALCQQRRDLVLAIGAPTGDLVIGFRNTSLGL